MFKNIVLAGLTLMAGLGLLTPGTSGINFGKAAELGLPLTYYFREVPFQPEKLAGGCQGAECKPANFVLNHEVTGLGQ